MQAKDNIYTEEDLEFLTALANQAAIAIDNMQLHKQILADAVARHELEIGKKIQRDFLPDTMPQLPGWEFAATFTPATQVSGDFYDLFTLPSGDIGLAIGDVSEHGVGSALFMTLFRSLIRVFSTNTYLDNGSTESPEIIQNEPQPSDLNLAHVNALRAVSLTNDYVAKTHNSKPDSNYYFATLFFGVLDPMTGTLTYINAGHEPPLVVINQNGIKILLESTTKVVIGTSPNRKFSIQQIHLEIGDILIGCTDGVPDAKSSSGNRFTKEQLIALLGEYCQSAQATLDLVEKKVKEHVGDAERFDDITMLAICRRPVQ
jgi:phosphoserine phosphatase RsbU/P